MFGVKGGNPARPSTNPPVAGFGESKGKTQTRATAAAVGLATGALSLTQNAANSEVSQKGRDSSGRTKSGDGRTA